MSRMRILGRCHALRTNPAGPGSVAEVDRGDLAQATHIGWRGIRRVDPRIPDEPRAIHFAERVVGLVRGPRTRTCRAHRSLGRCRPEGCCTGSSDPRITRVGTSVGHAADGVRAPDPTGHTSHGATSGPCAEHVLVRGATGDVLVEPRLIHRWREAPADERVQGPERHRLTGGHESEARAAVGREEARQAIIRTKRAGQHALAWCARSRRPVPHRPSRACTERTEGRRRRPRRP